LGSQGVREHVKGVTLLPKMAELGTHLVEGAIIVAGAVLELLPPTDQNQ
jgi:2-keto-4-pentenoate hydratase